MIRRLIILLLIVGCGESDSNNKLSLKDIEIINFLFLRPDIEVGFEFYNSIKG